MEQTGTESKIPRILRRTYYVNMKAQLEIVLYILFVLTLVESVLFWSVHSMFSLFLSAEPGTLPLPSPLHDLLSEQRRTIELVFISTYVVSLFFVFLGSTILSNRIMGPVHRITGALRQMLDGKSVAKITLRKGDFFTDLAELVNEISEKKGA